MIEAAERLADGHETKRLTELFVVSTLGLLVNLVGMAAFGHHHHGHDHSHGGHDHSHEGHDHKHEHEHDHDHDHDDKECKGHDHSKSALTVPAASAHSHGHDNDNMWGIYLHVMADTMGSAAVIVSTILMATVGWAGWDPLASMIIAGLIFASSIPLVNSSARKLLLTVPDDTEYQLRNTLAGISGLRGVASYHVPRFWMADKAAEGASNEVLGVMHIIATRGQDLDDLRERARAFLSSNGMDVVVQVEREGGGKCWCGGDTVRTPATINSSYS
jgi:zinc transporter 5/7